jgi:hypothetical protein
VYACLFGAPPAIDIPGVGTAPWYGLYTIGIAHVHPKLDVNGRVEWFYDEKGSRTGVAAHFSEVTLGINYMAHRWLNFRPEIRADFADRPAFGGNLTARDRAQLTGGIEVLMKY